MEQEVELHEDIYTQTFPPKISVLREVLAKLYDATYQHDPRLAWIVNPQFIKIQHDIDMLERALQQFTRQLE